MAIRKRIKRKLKKLLGRTESTPNYSSPTHSAQSPINNIVQTERAKETVVSAVSKSKELKIPTPSTIVNESSDDISSIKPEEQEAFTEKTITTAQNDDSSATEAKASNEIKKEVVTSDENSSNNNTPGNDIQATVLEVDETGASFVFAITNLFPVECPHCNTPSFGNWGRRENQYICQSCDRFYE